MIRMKSPTPNRKGVYEIHDVPSRRVEPLRAAGWTEVKPEKKAAKAVPEPINAFDGNTFNMAADKWQSLRGQIKEALELEKAPKSKDEAREMLQEAGYEIINDE